MLAKLKEGAAGMVTNTELMKSYNLAGQLVSETFANQLPDAMTYLRKVSAATGQDMSYMIDSLVRGVGRLSPMILDNLGIQADLTAANEAYAASVGKSADALSKSEQQTAVMSAVMAQLAANTAAMPDVLGTSQQRLMAFRTEITNLKEALGSKLQPFLNALLDTGMRMIPVLERLANGFATLMQPVAAAIKAAGPLIVGELEKIIAVVAPYGEGITQSLANGIRQGAVYVLAAMMVLRGIITYWLKPGSPPKLLPDLTDWGSGAAEAWFKGWTEADYGTLREMSGAMQGILSGLVAEGALEQGQANPLLRAMRAQVAAAMNELRATGTISEATFAGLRGAGGPAGAAAEALARSYLKAQEAGQKVADIQKQMQGTTDYETLRGLTAQLEIAKQQQTEAQGLYDAERARLEALTEESNLQQQIAAATQEAASALERAAAASKDTADGLAGAADMAKTLLAQLPEPEAITNPFEEMFNPEKLSADAQMLADTIMQKLIGEKENGPLPVLRRHAEDLKTAIGLLAVAMGVLAVRAIVMWLAALGPVGLTIAGIGVAVYLLKLAWDENWLGMRDTIQKWRDDIIGWFDEVIDKCQILLWQLGLLDPDKILTKPVSPETDQTLGWTTREKAFGTAPPDYSGGPSASIGPRYAAGLDAWVNRPTFFPGLGWVAEGGEPERLQITPKSKQQQAPTIIINNPAPEPAEDSINRAWGRMQFLYGT